MSQDNSLDEKMTMSDDFDSESLFEEGVDFFDDYEETYYDHDFAEPHDPSVELASIEDDDTRKKKLLTILGACVVAIIGIYALLYMNGYLNFSSNNRVYKDLSFESARQWDVVDEQREIESNTQVSQVSLKSDDLSIHITAMTYDEETLTYVRDKLFTEEHFKKEISHLKNLETNFEGDVRYVGGWETTQALSGDVQAIYDILDIKNRTHYQFYIIGPKAHKAEIIDIYKSVKLNDEPISGFH